MTLLQNSENIIGQPVTPKSFYVGTQQDLETLNNTINSNCGFPSAYATQWAEVRQAFGQIFFFVEVPSTSGYTNGNFSVSQQQMIQNVGNQQQLPFDSSWLPPFTP